MLEAIINSFTLLIEQIAILLNTSHAQLATAESCTGGLVASVLTQISGSSAWFDRGFVTYSNMAKQEMLAVPEELIQKFGAVSEEVAQAMAKGALQHSKAQFALSVTGIAGPAGGTVEKPVGTVCFAWASQYAPIRTLKKKYTGNRQEIRLLACSESLQGLANYLNDIATQKPDLQCHPRQIL